MVILTNVKIYTKKAVYVLQAILLAALPLLFTGVGQAAELGNRSVAISTAIPSAQANQIFTFSIPSAAVLGSIKFEQCDNSPFIGAPCSAPVGLSLSSATLSSQTTNTGFTIDIINSSINSIVLTRIPGAATLGVSTYAFSGITNSSTPNQTIYVRLSTYASVDATGPANEKGAVAYAILGGFSVGAFVPPFLIFCAAVTVSLNCGSTTGSLIAFGELSTTSANTATSQFSGATNDPAGYSVIVSGQTMTAGNQIIPPLSSNAASSIGTSQFGLNLRQNTVPSVGADQSGSGTAVANANYNTPNVFRFVNGEQLVNSAISTDYNLHTVSYLVNISTAQQPGYYATTLTYIATAAF